MQPSWNLLSCSRPHHVTPKKARKTNGFWSICEYAGLLESLVLESPSLCDLQKTSKNQWFLKHFGICSLLGISYFRTAFKVHTKSPQDRPKIAQERPKTPQDLQHGANIMPKRGPKRSPRHVRRVSERGFKSDFNLCSHGAAVERIGNHVFFISPKFLLS